MSDSCRIGLFDRLEALDPARVGRDAYLHVQELYPILRSITGSGVRRTLAHIRDSLHVDSHDVWTQHEVPSGERVLDWTVPKEWNVTEAWIRDPAGQKIVDLKDHTLHLLSYSTPVRASMSLEELDEHLHSLPEHPELIPYRTSYYAENWGFCLPHRVRAALEPGSYEVCIDSTLDDGTLSYGELFLPGRNPTEVLLSTHICHPSMCNDNLSGITVLLALAREIAAVPLAERRYSYRFLFLPGTIGSICWLAANPDCVERVAHGLVAANLGDSGEFHFKQPRRDAGIDRAVRAAFECLEESLRREEFSPFGYDERQYCSPGFDLPVGSLTRTPWGRYPQYHTSADDLGFVTAESLGESVRAYLTVLCALESDRCFRNLEPYGEPQLGRRGLYDAIGGAAEPKTRQLALLWMLNQSDGQTSLLQIAERASLDFRELSKATEDLLVANLLKLDEPCP